jgi:N-hydroxyarylamine O-acetyltransferase
MTTTSRGDFVPAYLDRIGFDQPIGHDIETVAALQRAHLTTVPFENLHIFEGLGVGADLDWSLAKIIDQRRGGWSFELNGAFAALLSSLDFEVALLGAAALHDGPNATIDHLALEVALEVPYLVDVGFGRSFVEPLRLNDASPQSIVGGTYQLLPSPQGTTVTEMVDDVPWPLYRFKRVKHALADFEPTSNRLQADTASHWHQHRFATRLVDGGPDRVSLRGGDFIDQRGGQTTVTPVPEQEWEAMLLEWFGLTLPAHR